MKRRGKAAAQTAAVPALPKLARNFDATSRGFAREGTYLQGVYTAGGQPTIFDPSFTEQRVPEAVLRHEEVHENLHQQTFHGVLTLILTEYVRVAEARAALAACMKEQWLAQELGATYAELAFVQRAAPRDFSSYIDSLPSAKRDEDPYREAFDFANWLLPLDDAASHERNDPRTLVIAALCTCSMGTACLRELATSDFDDVRFASWITLNSPSARLEQIARAAGPAAFLAMTQTVARKVAADQPTKAMLDELFAELSIVMQAHVPALTIEPLAQLRVQAQAAVDRLRKNCPAFEFNVEKALTPAEALFTDSPDKRKTLQAQFRFDDSTVELDEWLQACQYAGGLHMISGLPDPGKAPSIALVCIPSFPGNPPPDDARITLRPDDFFKLVERFPGFPNVMSMVGDGWPYWDAYFDSLPKRHWAHKRVREAIRITVHRSQSSQLLVQLLVRENLYDGARCILLELEDGGGMALFDNPRVNAVYAMQRVHSELALDELRRFLKVIKVNVIEDPRSIVDFELLYWIVQREFNAPGRDG